MFTAVNAEYSQGKSSNLPETAVGLHVLVLINTVQLNQSGCLVRRTNGLYWSQFKMKKTVMNGTPLCHWSPDSKINLNFIHDVNSPDSSSQMIFALHAGISNDLSHSNRPRCSAKSIASFKNKDTRVTKLPGKSKNIRVSFCPAVLGCTLRLQTIFLPKNMLANPQRPKNVRPHPIWRLLSSWTLNTI